MVDESTITPQRLSFTHVKILKEILETDDDAETGFIVEIEMKDADEIEEKKRIFPFFFENQKTKKSQNG